MADIAINPVTRRVQFTGNTGTGPFAFTFNILADEDIAVYKNTTLLTLTTHYSVTTNANGTGSITLVAGQALISSDVLTIIGGRDLSRTTDFVTAGDLLASSLNEQLDSLVIMTQQLDEKVGRTIKTNPGDVYTDLELPTKDNRKGTVLGFNATSGDPEVGPTIADVSSLASITADIATLADIEDGTDATDAIQTVAGISANVTTVAGISANVTTVAGNTSNINAVAADATDIGTVAGSISNVNTVAGIDSDITTVAGNTTNINTVAGVSSNVTTVAGISSDVTTVAGISSDVTTVAADGTDIGTVATNIADVNTVASNIATISEKVSKSGDTMTGDLTIQGNLTVSGTTITIDTATAQTVDLGDDDKIRLGDGNDLQIYHDSAGTTSYISETGTSTLAMRGTRIELENKSGVRWFQGSGLAATMYYSGASRVTTALTGVEIDGSDGLITNTITEKTTNTGVTIDGVLLKDGGATVTADVSFGDNDKAIFGAGSDLQIYHDGSHSYVEDVGTGNLYLRGDQLALRSSSNNEAYLFANVNGAVSLYYDGSAKLATTSTGVDITGTLTSDGLTLNDGTTDVAINSSNVNSRLDLIASRTSSNLASFRFKDNQDRNKLNIDQSGDISFYEDTGTTAKFFWDASAESLGIGTSSPSRSLEVYGAVTPRISIVSGNTSTGSSALLFGDTDADNIGSINYAHVDNSMRFSINAAERMRIDSSGNVGIGVTNPSDFTSGGNNLVVGTGSGDQGISIYAGLSSDSSVFFVDSSSGTGAYRGQIRYRHDVDDMSFHTAGGFERMRIDSSGNVGIGTSSPTSFSTYKYLDVVGSATTTGGVIQSKVSDNSVIAQMFTNATGGVFGTNTNHPMVFNTNNTEVIRIDSSGNLLVGTTTNTFEDAGVVLKNDGLTTITRDNSRPLAINRLTSDGDIIELYKDGTTVGSIGALGGDMVLGTGDVGFRFDDGSDVITPWNISTNSARNSAIDLGHGTARFKDLYLSGGVLDGTTTGYSFISGGSATNNGSNIFVYGGSHASNANTTIFRNGSSETMRIDSSGNLLVGKTSSSSSIDGTTIFSSGYLATTVTQGTANSGSVAQFRRGSTDGSIVNFLKDSTTVGSIGTSNSYLYIGEGDVGLAFRGASDYILPWNPSTNSTRDNAIDIGNISYRFDDIYATNGTIQTSDRNEKQDIAELSDAEQRVAVAAKGLLRKFRWRDAVEEKGDEARTHFGIIAQDLQAAFEAEGLDAGDYAMFIHSTWTDEETGEERSRMGVRYSELLAFIIAAI